jgi:tetratricopeptide (TPR) repeat protein
MHALQTGSMLAQRLLQAVLPASLALVGLTGCQGEQVVRVKDGRAYHERSIAPEAYAAYARARLNEAQGNDAAAMRGYEHVLDLDNRAGQAWIRLGALQCRTNPKAAERAWQQASEIAAESPQLWVERARCALARGELKQANDFALQALEFAPSQPQVSLLCANIASRLGNSDHETQLLFGALAMHPANVALLTALATSPTQPPAYQRYATRRLIRLRPIDETWVPPVYIEHSHLGPTQRVSALHLQEQFEQALSQHDADEALRIATLLGVRPDRLALAAFFWGFDSLAAQQASVLLALNPSDASAWLIALLEADVSGAREKLDELLAHPPQSSSKLEPALLEALFALIQRRTPPEMR